MPELPLNFSVELIYTYQIRSDQLPVAAALSRCNMHQADSVFKRLKTMEYTEETHSSSILACRTH